MPKLEEEKPDVYERALAKAELLTAYTTRPSIGAAITLLRALLVERRLRVTNTGEANDALAAFVGDTHV